MRRTFLLLLGAFPTAFSRALSSSDAPPLPIEIRSPQHKNILRASPRDETSGKPSSITRRGQHFCKGNFMYVDDDDDDKEANCERVRTTEIQVCEASPTTDPDSCAIEVVPTWIRRVDKQEDERPIEVLIERGKKGLALVATPQQSQDFLPQLQDNYVVTNMNDIEWRRNGVGEDVPWLSFFKKYGFEEDNGWKGVWVHSKGYMIAWIVNLSIARSTKHGKDAVAIIAHYRYASNDANRYTIKNNAPVVDIQTSKYVPLPAQEVAAKAVPVAQLVYFAAKQTKLLDSAPEKYFLVCDNIANKEAQEALDTACYKMGQDRNDKFTLRADAPGVEGEMFNLVVGTDPTYSWLHTIGRNPDTFGDYRINSIEVRTYVYMVAIELVKK